VLGVVGAASVILAVDHFQEHGICFDILVLSHGQRRIACLPFLFTFEDNIRICFRIRTSSVGLGGVLELDTP